jgi:hypothetical protein
MPRPRTLPSTPEAEENRIHGRRDLWVNRLMARRARIELVFDGLDDRDWLILLNAVLSQELEDQDRRARGLRP